MPLRRITISLFVMNEKKKIDIDICFSKAIMLNSISQQTLTQVSGVI
jgi:hypothetical protein